MEAVAADAAAVGHGLEEAEVDERKGFQGQVARVGPTAIQTLEDLKDQSGEAAGAACPSLLREGPKAKDRRMAFGHIGLEVLVVDRVGHAGQNKADAISITPF